MAIEIYVVRGLRSPGHSGNSTLLTSGDLYYLFAWVVSREVGVVVQSENGPLFVDCGMVAACENRTRGHGGLRAALP